MILNSVSVSDQTQTPEKISITLSVCLSLDIETLSWTFGLYLRSVPSSKITYWSMVGLWNRSSCKQTHSCMHACGYLHTCGELRCLKENGQQEDRGAEKQEAAAVPRADCVTSEGLLVTPSAQYWVAPVLSGEHCINLIDTFAGNISPPLMQIICLPLIIPSFPKWSIRRGEWSIRRGAGSYASLYQSQLAIAVVDSGSRREMCDQVSKEAGLI